MSFTSTPWDPYIAITIAVGLVYLGYVIGRRVQLNEDTRRLQQVGDGIRELRAMLEAVKP